MTTHSEVSRATTTNFRPVFARAGALALVASLTAVAACAAPTDGAPSDEGVDEAQSAVVGGSADADYKYPWSVSVQSALGCRGVLLTPYTVLTAAHCIAKAGGTVSFERIDPYTGVKDTDARSFPSYGIHIHPNYDAANGYHDIALVSVVTPFVLGPHLQTVGLPKTPNVTGAVGTVANASHSATLPAGQIALFRAPMGEPVAALGYFQAESTTASLCPGDSGSGFVTYEGGRAVVRGIASETSVSNNGCTAPYGWATFADVFAHHDWILSTMHTTDGDLVGNTRVHKAGNVGKGVFGIGCTNPYGTQWGPLNVTGVEVGANCAAGDTQSVVCALQGTQLTTIRAFTMKTTFANGTSTTQALPFSPTAATYYGVMPAGVTREFTCSLSYPNIYIPPGNIGRL